ncbi:MAG TPA: sulfite exporter TauE/SafE family protein [Chitinivibrionales bacterium]|nr:sulfite exporter TauE/SafE family protein [Chitinivibrionales bacterium]
MSTLLAKIWKVIFISLLFVALSLNPVLAHNTSWNKALIIQNGNQLTLKLRVVQVDLLGEVDKGIDSTAVLSTKEWNELLPKIKSYVFDNIALKIDGSPVTNVVDESWKLEDNSNGAAAVDTLMRAIEISRSWNFAGVPHTVEFKPDLLEHVVLPVKWVVVLATDRTKDRRLFKVISRGETAYFDFDKSAFVNQAGKLLSGSDESTLWGRISLFVKTGFNTFSLEKIFKPGENPSILIIYLFLAIIIGALHALSPGHGKALIGAYIIGNRGTVADAVTLGIVTAISHTLSVLVLGVIILIAFNSVVPPRMNLYLNVASGSIIIIIGALMSRKRLMELNHADDHHGRFHDHHTHSHDHDEEHGHSHDEHNDFEHSYHHLEEHRHSHSENELHEFSHGHGHSHSHEHSLEHEHAHGHQHVTMESIQKKGFMTNVIMGISGGMVPCPTALVVLFLAVSVKKVALGLLLIVFFSFGLAATLTILGILFAKGSSLINKYDKSKFLPKLPVFSSILIILIGAAIVIRAMLAQG